MAELSALYELSTAYLACRDVDSLLKTFAAQLGKSLGARAVLVWMGAEGEALRGRARWFEPGERFETVSEPVVDGLLVEMQQAGTAQRLRANEADPELYLHLTPTHRERVQTALYAPLLISTGVAGVVEVLNKKSGEFSPDDAALAEEASRITGRLLESLQAAEQDQLGNLATVQRLTELYDISRIFNSTIELQELLPVIAAKILELSGGQACNIWLADPEANDLYLARQAGVDASTEEEGRTPIGEGLAGVVAQEAKPRLVENALEESLLADRQEKDADFKIETAICTPLLKDDRVLGVIEVVNKRDGAAFNEDDLFLLTNVAEQAAIALNNASLLEAERKVHVLDALLQISREITSTLDLDHVLSTVVHQAAQVVPFERCAIGFYDRNRFVIGAVSGEAEVPKSPEMNALRDALEWVGTQTEPVAVDLYEDGWRCQPEEARAQLTPLLEAQGYNGFYALPLGDDQGRLGTIALLSGDADFLTETNKETLSILANQTSVAIRNAQLYQQMPLANWLQPLAEKKQKLMAAMPYSRWLEWAWKAGVAALLLIAIPAPMRVSTNATVVPAERRLVTAQVTGVIGQVHVHEGARVSAGQLLAQLDSSDDRVKLAQAEAALALARRQLAEAEFGSDLTAAGQARLQSNLSETEVKFEQNRVNDAQLRAPIPGVVVTPKVEEKAGTLLNQGDIFCELVRQDTLAVEMSVPESDMDLVAPGARVVVKLNAYPTTTFPGTVERLGAQAKSEEGDQYFLVRGLFQNTGEEARDGMVGKAKITARGGWFGSGWYPVGYLIFRSPVRWIWGKVWGWTP